MVVGRLCKGMSEMCVRTRRTRTVSRESSGGAVEYVACVSTRLCVCACASYGAPYLLHRLAHNDLIRVVVLERERVVRRLALVLDLVDPRVEVLRGAGRRECPRRRATGSGGGSSEHGKRIEDGPTELKIRRRKGGAQCVSRVRMNRGPT